MTTTVPMTPSAQNTRAGGLPFAASICSSSFTARRPLPAAFASAEWSGPNRSARSRTRPAATSARAYRLRARGEELPS
ncbi:hypothetical protein ACFXGI_07305 [Streptomyces sp. NPDC059355]|uniref:hypothetical protein n=1 Tax=Streptomyces sp. NPDC059355 TaxID=3346811 RepID=UPI00369C149F